MAREAHAEQQHIFRCRAVGNETDQISSAYAASFNGSIFAMSRLSDFSACQRS
jgi:hypothetical protein